MYLINAQNYYDTRQYRWLVEIRTNYCDTHRATLGDILEVLLTGQARLTRAHVRRLYPKCIRVKLVYSDVVDP